MGENIQLKTNQKNANIFEENLKLETLPVAIKFINSEDEIPDGIKIVDNKMRHCEMVRKASYGDIFYSTSSEQKCKGGAGAIGLEDMPPKLASGELYYNLGRFKDLETAKKTVNELSIIKERHWGIIYSPLKDADFKPDVVIILAKPIVGMKIAQSIVYTSGDKVKPSFAGIQSLCGDVVANPYINKGFNLTLGCDGSRKEADIKDEEMAIGISVDKLDEVIENLIAI